MKKPKNVKIAETAQPCPSCGHCPTCGRSGITVTPVYHPVWINPQPMPWWVPGPIYTSPTITWGGTGTYTTTGGTVSLTTAENSLTAGGNTFTVNGTLQA